MFPRVGDKPCEDSGSYQFSEIFRSLVVRGISGFHLQSKRQIMSGILHHKEGSSVLGRPLWVLGTKHPTPRIIALVHISGDIED